MIIDLLFAFLVALAASIILALLYHGRGVKRAGGWSGFLFLFLLILLATWAGGIWIAPIGPVLWDGYWLTFAITGTIIALLFAALLPQRPSPRSRNGNSVRVREEEELLGLTLGAFFWIAITAMAIAIITYYV